MHWWSRYQSACLAWRTAMLLGLVLPAVTACGPAGYEPRIADPFMQVCTLRQNPSYCRCSLSVFEQQMDQSVFEQEDRMAQQGLWTPRMRQTLSLAEEQCRRYR